MYEFIEYSKERIRVYFMATSLFPKPISEFTDFAAVNAIVRLFFALLNIIATAFEMFDESILFLFIISFIGPLTYMLSIGTFFKNFRKKDKKFTKLYNYNLKYAILLDKRTFYK